ATRAGAPAPGPAVRRRTTCRSALGDRADRGADQAQGAARRRCFDAGAVRVRAAAADRGHVAAKPPERTRRWNWDPYRCGFEDGKFEGEILAELRRLREHDIIRMVDLLFVAKDEQGDIAELEH